MKLMKKVHLMLACMLMLGLWGFEAPYDAYSEYVPILLKRSVLEHSIEAQAPRSLQNPGKLYAKSDTLYIVEKFKGVHVIMNGDPANPEIKHFIRIPGVVDVSVKGNVLYADNAVDLISIDISSVNDLKVLDRVRNVFPELAPPGYRYIPYEFTKGNRPENTVIVNWKRRGQS